MFEKLKTTFKKVSFKTIKPKEEFQETNQLKKESKEMNSKLKFQEELNMESFKRER
jgi:hypothetical protein